MPKVYCLRIHVLQENFLKVSKILNLVPNDVHGWAYSFSGTNDNYLAILDKMKISLSKLNKIESMTDKIEFWVYYEYADQCNLEFEPEILQKLSKIGCTLCISCWESK